MQKLWIQVQLDGKVDVLFPLSTARVILGQVLSIATCGSQSRRGDSLRLHDNLDNH